MSGRGPLPELLDGDAIAARLSMRAAIDVLHAELARPSPDVPQRLHLTVDATDDTTRSPRETADLLVMPAAADGWAGTKMVGVVPGNPQRDLPQVTASYTLFGPPGLVPRAVLDGATLTGLRTAAVSGLATRLAARSDARRVVVIGSGVQARWHVLAMAAVIEGAHISIVGRDAARVDALIDDVVSSDVLSSDSSVTVVAGGRGAIVDADVVCVCTSSTTPVVALADLAPGVHVNAIGAHRPDRREIAPDAVAASRVLVGTRGSALTEKGDLLLAERDGAWSRDAILADLHEAASGSVAVRTRPEDRTLFASVGHALEDLIVARAVVEGRAAG